MKYLLKGLAFFCSIYFMRAQVFNPIQCSQGMHRCGDNSKCVADKDLCDFSLDCNDFSDESFPMCKAIQEKRLACPIGQISHPSYRCQTISSVCSKTTGHYREEYNIFCNQIVGGLKPFSEIAILREEKSKLKTALEEATSQLEQETKIEGILAHLATSFNETQRMKNESTGCPPLYVNISGRCVALFTVAQVSWNVGKQFCESISGTLGVIKKIKDYEALLKNLKSQKLETNFWIGGKFESKPLGLSTWNWLDKTDISMGAPYWTSLYSQNCTQRGSSDVCYHYTLAPTENRDGFCLAMDFQFHYYFSDANCAEKRSPLCFLNKE